MKKQVFFLAVLALCLGMGMAHAQINVNASKVEIGSPLSVNTIVAPASDMLTFELGSCNLKIGYSSSYGKNKVVGINTYPYLWPTVSDAMSLGTPFLHFKNGYISYIYATTVSQSSDARLKENILDLKNATSSLLNLRPVSFDFKPTENADTVKLKNKVGFLAQEVQQILPHLVDYMEEVDVYTLDYISMIPYLVKGFQEEHAANERLRQQLEDMQETIDLLWDKLNEKENLTSAPKNSKKSASANETNNAGTLSQNMPNPFSENTTIAYTLPVKAKASSLNIYSSTGNLVQTYVLPTGVQKGTITVEGHTLTPGLYTYSLIVGGRVLDSKRMVVTE